MRVLSLEGHSESASPAADDRCRDAQASKLNDDICANRCGCNAFKPGPAKGHIEQSIDYQSPGRLYLCRVARGSRSDERRRGCSTHIRQASASTTILYQLQSKQSARESRNLVPSSIRNAQITPANVIAKSMTNSRSNGHCTNRRLRPLPLAVSRNYPWTTAWTICVAASNWVTSDITGMIRPCAIQPTITTCEAKQGKLQDSVSARLRVPPAHRTASGRRE